MIKNSSFGLLFNCLDIISLIRFTRVMLKHNIKTLERVAKYEFIAKFANTKVLPLPASPLIFLI